MMTDDLENKRTPLLCYFKLVASFCSHWWIQTGVPVRKCSNQVIVFVPCDLEIWRITLKINRAPLLCHFKLSTSFRNHQCYSPENAQIEAKFVLTSVTFTFDLWPWPFAWTSLLSMVITSEILWWHDDSTMVKSVTDEETGGWTQTDRRTGRTVLRAASSQLKYMVMVH